MTALLLNVVLVGEPRGNPSPDKVVDAVLCYWPDVPRHSPLVRLPNMSFRLRSPERATRSGPSPVRSSGMS